MHITHVKYSGRRVDQDFVYWFDMPLNELVNQYFNTGDVCVYESTLRLMGERTGGYDLNIDEPVNRNVVAMLREQRSTILLRGSNYLHEEMDWNYFDDWLEALHLPVVACGIGAQAETKRPIMLSQAGRRVWKLIADHCETIGVRGSFSAETLERNGIRNSEVVGCPSIFRARNRELFLRHAPSAPARITFSIRREVDKMYSIDPVEFRQTQKRLISKMDLACDLYLSCHGEPEEKAFFFRSPAARAAALSRFVADGWFDHITGAAMRRLYDSKLYYVAHPSDYDYYIPQFDAALGYRVHAVLPALALGVPGLLLDYDTRSSELAETFDLPIETPAAMERLTLAEAFDKSRFTQFESNFPQRYDNMKNFLSKNGVTNRM